MRFARARQAAFLPAAPYLFLSIVLLLCSSSPAVSQVRVRRPPGAHSASAFPADFLENAEENNRLSTFRSLAARYSAAPSSVFVDPRLLSFGDRGLLIEQARQHVLAILAIDNPCTAWFREADPNVAAIFESLNFYLDDGPKDVLILKSASGEVFFKHPYSAAVPQNAGRDAVIALNANGAFFNRAAFLRRYSDRGVASVDGHRELRVGPYAGDTLTARVTTLLHELGHVVGRLPDDSDELSGLSDQNTQRLLHACHAEINASAHQPSYKGNDR